MDCEKFEPLLLDELYEELDELTSAAVKRHVSGCARCASQLEGMAATRDAVSLPLVPVPAGLEDRILAAAKEAQKVVPIRGRLSRALSAAGSWAMRPQTAMAAVFLLMIGTSAFLIRSKGDAGKESAVSVTVAGAPSPTAEAESESMDDKAAAAAHGPTPPNVTRPAPPPAASLAFADDEGQMRRAKKADEPAFLSDPSEESKSKDRGLEPPAAIANASTPAGAPAATQAPLAKSGSGSGGDPSSLGAAAFRARNFAEATRQFDLAAKNGDPNAALWAAESTREGKGCAVAVGRFVQLAQSEGGSWVGHEASLRAARCQIALGQLDAARARLDALAQVSSHQQAAQQAQRDLNKASERKGGGAAAGGAVAAPRRAPSPAPMKQEKASPPAQGY